MLEKHTKEQPKENVAAQSSSGSLLDGDDNKLPLIHESPRQEIRHVWSWLDSESVRFV